MPPLATPEALGVFFISIPTSSSKRPGPSSICLWITLDQLDSGQGHQGGSRSLFFDFHDDISFQSLWDRRLCSNLPSLLWTLPRLSWRVVLQPVSGSSSLLGLTRRHDHHEARADSGDLRVHDTRMERNQDGPARQFLLTRCNNIHRQEKAAMEPSTTRCEEDIEIVISVGR